jgi:methionyl-tRNA synthetase
MTEETGIFTITTPLYYANAPFHLGHAYSTYVCDTLVRFYRMQGYDTYFITGSDEHGEKIKQAADALGLTPIEWTDRVVEEGKKLWKRCDIEYDYFVRTTQRKPDDHYRDVQRFFKRIFDRGDIYLGTYEGLYCVGCEKYLTEKDLVEGKCPDHDKEPILMQEPCLFFKLSKWAPVILEMLENQPDRVRPESRRNEVISKLKSGVDDLAVSRTKLDWGIPLDDIEPGHVCYVWFDALLGYATAAGIGKYLDELDKKEADPDYEIQPTRFAKYWPHCVHVIAKDILWFHTVIWPAMLLAAELDPDDPAKMVTTGTFSHGYLLERGRKMSKSVGNILDPYPYLDLLGSDALRFYLLREVVFGEDGSINHEAIAERTNADLANDLGNLLNRTLAMLDKDTGGMIPPEGPHNSNFIDTVKIAHDGAVQAMKEFAPHRALDAIWQFVRVANRNIEETAPWELRKNGKYQELSAFLYDQAQALYNLAILLHPFIPNLTREIWKQLGQTGDIADVSYHNGSTWGSLDPATCINKGEPIVPRIDINQFLEDVKKLSDERSRQREELGQMTAEKKEVPEFKEEITYDEFQKLDLRSATVLECEPVKGADKLLKLKIDLGREQRQIVAGIAKTHKPEDLIGKQIIIVANLKPVRLKGEESRGMLLATGDEENVTLLIPAKPVDPGETVH